MYHYLLIIAVALAIYYFIFMKNGFHGLNYGVLYTTHSKYWLSKDEMEEELGYKSYRYIADDIYREHGMTFDYMLSVILGDIRSEKPSLITIVTLTKDSDLDYDFLKEKLKKDTGLPVNIQMVNL